MHTFVFLMYRKLWLPLRPSIPCSSTVHWLEPMEIYLRQQQLYLHMSMFVHGVILLYQ